MECGAVGGGGGGSDSTNEHRIFSCNNFMHVVLELARRVLSLSLSLWYLVFLWEKRKRKYWRWNRSSSLSLPFVGRTNAQAKGRKEPNGSGKKGRRKNNGQRRQWVLGMNTREMQRKLLTKINERKKKIVNALKVQRNGIWLGWQCLRPIGTVAFASSTAGYRES